MATAYISDWKQHYFKEIGFREPAGEGPTSKFVKNGKIAAASTCNDIAGNQHWLALRDCDAINFLHKQDASETTRARVILNPFCEWIELYFLVWKQFSGNFSTAQSYVQVNCSTTSMTRTHNLIAGGETSAKPGESNIPDCQWIVFKDINANLTASDPGALRLRSSNVEAWGAGEFTVTTSSSVRIYAGYYRVLPPQTGLVVTA